MPRGPRVLEAIMPNSLGGKMVQEAKLDVVRHDLNPQRITAEFCLQVHQRIDASSMRSRHIGINDEEQTDRR